MSSPRLNANQYMRRIAKDDVVKKWPRAFIEDPSLTPEVFYNILISVKFDITEAQLKVIELVRKPEEFIIPAALLDGPLPTPPFSTPTTPEHQDDSGFNTLGLLSRVLPSTEDQDLPTATNSPTPTESPTTQYTNRAKSKSTFNVIEAAIIKESDEDVLTTQPATSPKNIKAATSKRRAPIEDSDDEILSFRGKRNRTQSSSNSPTRTSSVISSQTETPCGFLANAESGEDDDPPRLANRRPSKSRSTLSGSPPCTAGPSTLIIGKKVSCPKQPEHIEVVTLSSGEDSEDSADEAIKIQRPLCERGFSTTPDFGDESEYEVPSDNEELREISPDNWPSTPVRRVKRCSSSTDVQEKQTFGTKSKIWVTPLIADLWKKYYPDSLAEVPIVCLPRASDQAVSLKYELQELRNQAEKHTSSSLGEIKLNTLIQHDRKLDRKYFASADVDGVRYVPGDYVMVASQGLEVPEGRDVVEDSEAGNAEDPWFAQIIFIFRDGHDENLVHLRWFEHGARTLLGETANPRELFLFQSCDDNPLGCIIKKIKVEFVQNATNYDVESAETKFRKEGHYFYRQYWHPESRSFTHVGAVNRSRSIAEDNKGQANSCHCCSENAEKTANQKTRIIGSITVISGRATISAFSFYETVYRLHDFVYVVDGQREIYGIGQITQICVPRGTTLSSQTQSQEVDENNISVHIAFYRRYDDLLPSFQQEIESGGKHKVRDSRRLFATGAVIRISAVDLDGKCYVLHRDQVEDLDSFKDQKDTFWVQDRLSEQVNPKSSIRLRDLRPLDRDDMKYSAQSELELSTRMKLVQDFLKLGKKPQTLELFNGIGGLTIGFQGICGKVNAVEIDEAACHTMRTNQPDSTVHHGDASLLLSRAIRRDQGEELEAMFDKRGNLIPDLPRRGDVDFIKGGPPCPGYSSANLHKRVAEPRNGLVALFLAYVHFYQPKYSLIENVVGLIRHNLAVPRESEDLKTEAEVGHGTIKMVFRTFTSMGYQVQCAILNAEEHGAPQSRSRVFIWATLPGYRLPKYPQPEHVYKSRADSLLFEPDRKLGTFDFYWHRQRRSAPHKVVTLGDAFTDLPAFDWKNPHQVVAKTRFDEQKENERWNKFTLYDPFEVEQPFVGRNTQGYSSGPLTEYQRRLRAGRKLDTVKNHVTAKPNALSIEKVCSVPLRPGASYKDLPPALRNPLKAPQKNACARLDLFGIHNACMTKMDVLGRYGKIIHPTQHRIESVREYARVQGFPDSYVFDLDNWIVGDAIRGIGNAVPISLGRSVAEEFLDSWIEHVNGSSETFDTTRASDDKIGSSKDDAIDLISDDDE